MDISLHSNEAHNWISYSEMALGNELESTAIYDWNMQSNVDMATKLFKLSYFMLQRIRLSPGWSYRVGEGRRSIHSIT